MFLLCIGSLGGELDCFFQTSYPNPLLHLCTSHGESSRWQFSAGSGLSLSLSFMQQQQVNIDLSTMSLVSMCHQPRLPSSVSPSFCIRVEMNTHTHTRLQQSVLGYLSLGNCSSGCFPVVSISWSLKHCLNQVTLKWGRKKKKKKRKGREGRINFCQLVLILRSYTDLYLYWLV